MLLGAILKQLSNETLAAAELLKFDDLVLIGHVEAIRLEHEESIGEYVVGATRRFASQASASDWLRLSTALEHSDAPAATCLKAMVTWAVAQDRSTGSKAHGCTCGSREEE